MPPDDPGSPSPGPRDTAGTATFEAGAEPADGSEPPGEPSGAEPAAPEEPATPKVAPRRFLDDSDSKTPKAPKRQKVRARKVHRIVRHIEPWSVLKVSVLFFLSLFLIICVASAVLWNTARSAGVIDDVESFVTSLGFGNCEDIEGDDATTDTTTPTTISGADPQLGGSSTTVTVLEDTEDELSTIPDEDGKCAEGQRLVGGFKFEDERIFQSFALGGIVLVLSGAAFSVVLALLFNLISDLTGGVRVTVLEEDPVPGRRSADARPTPRTKV